MKRLNLELSRYVEQASALQKPGQQLARTIHKWVLQGGEPVRRLADLLHGTWLGHPLHPVLTDVVVGAWSLGALFDLISLRSPSRRTRQAADTLTAVGIVAALPTALSGVADFSTIPQSAAGTGLAHALAVKASLGTFILSLWARKKGQRGQGLFWSALGLALITLGAYLGGHLVFGKRVGVNRSERLSQPEAWTPVLALADLPEQQPKAVEVEGQPVLLYRDRQQVYAVSAICPHAKGPLAEGSFNGTEVQCPWHDSVFDLRGGHIVHGPSTYPLPCYEARFHNGQIEVRVTSD
ncbi:MAG: Rieske 2Fe-2S domain-containing protein [Anaerolineae bacterium]|nr:Rieske 2Fe-2S domain-containing protein [Anaerolineae bacterium]